MSLESAKSFMGKIQNDKELQGRFEGVKSEEQFFDACKECGFDFSIEEWNQAKSEGRAAELTEADLSSVAGGGTNANHNDCPGNGPGQETGQYECGTSGVAGKYSTCVNAVSPTLRSWDRGDWRDREDWSLC